MSDLVGNPEDRVSHNEAHIGSTETDINKSDIKTHNRSIAKKRSVISDIKTHNRSIAKKRSVISDIRLTTEVSPRNGQ